MKQHILVNLKRFDVPADLGGVNRLAPISNWAATVLAGVAPAVARYPDVEFMFFLPELHLLQAVAAARGGGPLIGCQGVHDVDVTVGGNFGALTSLRPAAAMAAAGVAAALVGHSEERAAVLELVGTRTDVDRIVNARARAAQAAGLRTVLCIGESQDERTTWRETITSQLERGLDGLDTSRLVLAYEPIWAIGPGKTPPSAPQVQEVAALVKRLTDLPLVYGGGLKQENAAALAGIPEIDGGLIALTRFSGEIGFYPNEFAEIIDTYLMEANHEG